MLADAQQFDVVEKMLHENGSIEKFEKESGKILGRMMTTLGEVPDDLGIAVPEGSYVFICTFDFYDCSLGLVLNTATKKSEGGIWITPQTDNDPEPPAEDWVEFFVETLLKGIDEDGGFGTPIYSLVNDSADLTVVPTL